MSSSTVHSKLLLAARGHREGHRALEVQQQAITLAIQQLPLDQVHLLPSETQAQYFEIMQQLAKNKNQTQRCGPPPLPSLVLDTAGHATQQDMKRKHESLGSTDARVVVEDKATGDRVMTGDAAGAGLSVERESQEDTELHISQEGQKGIKTCRTMSDGNSVNDAAARRVPRDLNVLSRSFDPARALAAGLGAVPLPVVDARLYDSVTVWPLRMLSEDTGFELDQQYKAARTSGHILSSTTAATTASRCSPTLSREREEMEEMEAWKRFQHSTSSQSSSMLESAVGKVLSADESIDTMLGGAILQQPLTCKQSQMQQPQPRQQLQQQPWPQQMVVPEYCPSIDYWAEVEQLRARQSAAAGWSWDRRTSKYVNTN